MRFLTSMFFIHRTPVALHMIILQRQCEHGFKFVDFLIQISLFNAPPRIQKKINVSKQVYMHAKKYVLQKAAAQKTYTNTS
jgi:hypothetical protein